MTKPRCSAPRASRSSALEGQSGQTTKRKRTPEHIPGILTTWSARVCRACLCRSAAFQSAVSQNCILRIARKFERPGASWQRLFQSHINHERLLLGGWINPRDFARDDPIPRVEVSDLSKFDVFDLGLGNL